MKNRKFKIGFAAIIPFLAACGGTNESIMSSIINTSGEDSSSSQNTTSSSSDSIEIPGEVQVILMGGQSNMEGHTHIEYLSKTCGAEKAKEYAAGYDNVKISYHNTYGHNSTNGAFTAVKVGQGYDMTRFGPEVGMAEEITKSDLKTPVSLIKWAVGGTALSSDWRSTSSGSAGSCYINFAAYVKQQLQALEEAGYFPVIKAFCWMQGEDDASGSGYANYLEYERNLIKDIRNDQGIAYYADAAGIGFIDAGIDDCSAWTHYQEVNAAKKALSKENPTLNRYFSTMEAGLKYNGEPAGAPDIYHFDSSSEIKLGNLFIQNAIDAGFLK